MPYLAHFGLKDYPFTLTPNVDYYYPTQENQNIIASIDFALRRDSGIIKIVGEVGTGKTLLCRLLINKLVSTDRVAYINAPQADAQSILRAICSEFGVDLADGASPYTALNQFLIDNHVEGRLAVVVVDEAQHLGKEGLEAVRLASNLETEKRKLLQIVLFGQTELDELMRDPSLRQLNQRIVFSFNTKPLTQAEAQRYIAHRLRVSRREGVEYDIFTPSALAAIARFSGGTPRVINILADKSLLVAYSDGSPTVQRKHAMEAIDDTPGLVHHVGLSWRLGQIFQGWKAAAAASIVTAAIVLGGWGASRAFHHAPEMTAASVASPSVAPAQFEPPKASPAPSGPQPAAVAAPTEPVPVAQPASGR